MEKALLEAAEKHNHILSKPVPQVWLSDFGNSSLNFQLVVWIKKSAIKDQIVSDVNKITYNLFNDYKIEIPFPQRDLNIKNPEDLNFNRIKEKAETAKDDQNEKINRK